MVSSTSHPSTTTPSTARHEIRDTSSSQGSFGSSPRGIMDFMDDEMEAIQHFILQRLNGSINHDLSSTSASEAIVLTSSSHPPAPILLLKPRHDCVNSLWNHHSNSNATRTQESRQQTSTPQPLSETDYSNINSGSSMQEPTLEIRVQEIPSDLWLPMDF